MAIEDVGIAVLLIAALGVTAVLGALALRPRSWVTATLSAYVLAVAETVLLTTALSPLRAVTRGGLLAGEAVLLVAAVAVWLVRQRPRLPRLVLPGGLTRDPGLLLLGVAVGAATLYELLLVFTAAPNNWDSLTYHLARAAAWAQHGGVYWISNAPTDRVNEFQPLAEQQVLLVLVATGRAALFALPQFVASCACVVAIYALARRVGYSTRPAAYAALLFASFPLVALEATTAQNDLVAAALPVVAAALILGGSREELALAGLALGLALGVKLTTAYVLPIPFALALLMGRSALRRTVVWAAGSFALLGVWGFVLNAAHTGHVLGYGVSRLTQQASPSLTGSPTTAFRVVYGLFDLSGLDFGLTTVLAVLGLVAGAVIVVAQRRRGESGVASVVAGSWVVLALVASRLTPVVAHGIHVVGNAVHLPVEAPASTGGRFFWGIDYGASEDLSSFGVLGGLLLLGLSFHQLVRGDDRARRVLAAALPVFLVLLALTSKYNPWLSRFLLVPVALAAPLFAAVPRNRAIALAVAVVASLQLLLVHVHNEQKPLTASGSRPWSATQSAALRFTFRPAFGAAYRALEARVPAGSCVGAVVGSEDPGFLLYGSRLERGVVYLPRLAAPTVAAAEGIRRVVLGNGAVAKSFIAARWSVRPLAPGSWSLAVAPRSRRGSNSLDACRSEHEQRR